MCLRASKVGLFSHTSPQRTPSKLYNVFNTQHSTLNTQTICYRCQQSVCATRDVYNCIHFAGTTSTIILTILSASFLDFVIQMIMSLSKQPSYSTSCCYNNYRLQFLHIVNKLIHFSILIHSGIYSPETIHFMVANSQEIL